MINYYLITKPGIILGNLITVAAGFLLASKGQIYPGLLLATLIGLTFIMASACVFNNYIDRPLDQKMARTKNRPLVTGLISGKHALFFGTLLGIIGGMVLMAYTNLLTVAVAGVGFFVYVILYSLWKSRTVYSTAIGSVAGAIPPVVGYCAVSNRLDSGALILFAMLVLWQMPHFFSIAMYHLEDYKAAGIPTLPVQKGAQRTKVHMLVYIIGFIGAALLLTVYQYAGYVYLSVTLALSLLWLFACMTGFTSTSDRLWGQRMFRLSLVLITCVSFVISIDTL